MILEQAVWTGGPSQLTIIGAVVGLPYACWRYLVTRNIRYEQKGVRVTEFE